MIIFVLKKYHSIVIGDRLIFLGIELQGVMNYKNLYYEYYKTMGERFK